GEDSSSGVAAPVEGEWGEAEARDRHERRNGACDRPRYVGKVRDEGEDDHDRDTPAGAERYHHARRDDAASNELAREHGGGGELHDEHRANQRWEGSDEL